MFIEHKSIELYNFSAHIFPSCTDVELPEIFEEDCWELIVLSHLSIYKYLNIYLI